MKDQRQDRLGSLVQTRETLVQLRTELKNKINNIAAAQGIELGKEVLSNEKGLERVLAMAWEETVRLELEVIVEQIRNLSAGIKKLEGQI
jgi:transposase